MKFITRTTPFALALAPMVALAQFGGEISSFVDDIVIFLNNTVVPLIFAIAFIVFLWGVVKYFIIGGDDNADSRKEGQQYMLYGIGAFVLMVSVWGIVNLLSEGFGFTDENIQNIPNAPTRNN